MKTHLSTILLALVVLLLLPVATHAQANDLEQLAVERIQALVTGDLDKAMSYYADDVTLTFTTPLPNVPAEVQGKEGVRAVLEGFVADNVSGELTGLSSEGNTVTAKLEITTDTFEQLGVAPVGVTEVYTFNDENKIQSYTFTISDESLAAIQAAMTAPTTVPETGATAPSLWMTMVALGALLLLLAVRWSCRSAG